MVYFYWQTIEIIWAKNNLDKKIRGLLEKEKIIAKTEPGQNFTISPGMIQAAMESAEINKEDRVIEAGAGIRFLKGPYTKSGLCLRL